MDCALVGFSQKSGLMLSASSLAISFSLPAMSKTHQHIRNSSVKGFQLVFFFLQYGTPFTILDL
jgi:hypothetical protein